MAVFQTCNDNGGNVRNHEQVRTCAELLDYSIKLWTVTNTDTCILLLKFTLFTSIFFLIVYYSLTKICKNKEMTFLMVLI